MSDRDLIRRGDVTQLLVSAPRMTQKIISAIAAIHPDPREEVIEALADALHAIELWDAARGYPIPHRHRDPMRAALAAAKAVQK